MKISAIIGTALVASSVTVAGYFGFSDEPEVPPESSSAFWFQETPKVKMLELKEGEDSKERESFVRKKVKTPKERIDSKTVIVDVNKPKGPPVMDNYPIGPSFIDEDPVKKKDNYGIISEN